MTTMLFPDGSCGHPSRLIRTDGINGSVVVECNDCDHEAAVRDRKERFDIAAFQRIAELAGLTVDVVRRRLRIKTPKPPRAPRPKRAKKEAFVPRCSICTVVLSWRGFGRPPKYCATHLPAKLRYNARKRGDPRLATAAGAISSAPGHCVPHRFSNGTR